MRHLILNRRMRILFVTISAVITILLFSACQLNKNTRVTEKFTQNWKFVQGDAEEFKNSIFDDSNWRVLNLPHDWSIEGEFSSKNPASPGGGALPGGIGWYRKTFTIPKSDENKMVFIDF